MDPTDIVLVADGSGSLLWVHVVPGARRSAVIGAHGDALRIAVTAPPSDGRANRALQMLLAAHVGVAPRDVEIVAGASSRRKRVRVALLPAVLRSRLAVTVED